MTLVSQNFVFPVKVLETELVRLEPLIVLESDCDRVGDANCYTSSRRYTLKSFLTSFRSPKPLRYTHIDE